MSFVDVLMLMLLATGVGNTVVIFLTWLTLKVIGGVLKIVAVSVNGK